MFSREIVLRCFPHKEAILWNLEVAIELSYSRDTLQDGDRLAILCKCHSLLVKEAFQEAADEAARAGYNLMKDAILEHFVV